MASVRILPDADRDLDEQAEYLEVAAGLETALRFYDSSLSTFERIARMPGIGESWRSSNPRLAGLRVCPIWGFENHVAFYRVVDEGVEVVRVLHGAREIDPALESTEA